MRKRKSGLKSYDCKRTCRIALFWVIAMIAIPLQAKLSNLLWLAVLYVLIVMPPVLYRYGFKRFPHNISLAEFFAVMLITDALTMGAVYVLSGEYAFIYCQEYVFTLPHLILLNWLLFHEVQLSDAEQDEIISEFEQQGEYDAYQMSLFDFDDDHGSEG